MKYLMIVLGALIAFGAWADNRIELQGDDCHLVWNNDNADDEHKVSCTVFTTQDGDAGTYSASSYGGFRVPREVLEAEGVPLPDKANFLEVLTSDCLNGNDGTIEDDNGNAYTSANCATELKYRGKPYKDYIWVTFKIQILNAAAQDAASVTEAGTSIMFREGMGYADPPMEELEKPVK